MEGKAVLRLARVAPQKARLVADLVRGRGVGDALEVLAFTQKKSAVMVKKLIESAVANVEHEAQRNNEQVDVDELVVKTIFVDQGPVLKRFRPRARGSASKVLKKTSHITVVVAEGVI